MNHLPETSSTIFGNLVDIISDGINPKTYITICSKGMDYYEKKRQEGFYTFVEQLYLGITDENKIKYEQNIISTEDDFFRLLSAALSDEEEKKSLLYANLYRSILEDKIPQHKKLKYIKMTKMFSYNALSLFPKIYSRITFNGDSQNNSRAINLYKTLTFNEHYGFDRDMIEQFKLIVTVKEFSPNISDEFIHFTNCIFREDDLNDTINGTMIKDDKISLIANSDYEKVRNVLERFPFQAIIKESFDSLNNVYNYPITSHCVCLLTDEPLTPEHKKYLIILSKQLKVKKVTLVKDITDPLPEIEGNLFYLEHTSDSELAFFQHIFEDSM